MIEAIFKKSCINCGGDISSLRLNSIGLCEKCIKNEKTIEKLLQRSFFERTKILYYILKKKRRLNKFKDIYYLEKFTNDFIKFFEKLINNKPWSAQITWARRIYKKESFSIVAPTGVGKTTFGIIISLFLLSKFKNINKIYFILPTTTLVDQVYERFTSFSEYIEKDIEIIRYSTSLSSKEKKEVKEKIVNGEFNILISTHQFLARSFDIISKNKFDFIFVDDVDAMLKASKNIDRVLLLLGFNENDLKVGEKLINLRVQIAKYLASNKNIRKLQKEIEKLEKYLEKRRKSAGILVLSSATGKAKGKKVKLFRELLGFEIGGKGEGLRKIEDIYLNKRDYETLYRVINDLGIKGGLIFVAKDLGIEEAEKIEEFLNSKGIKAKTLHSQEKDRDQIIDEFAKGNIDVLIGIAHFYGLLTRGLDLPEVIRYAIFYEVPRFKINATKAINNVFFILTLLNIIVKTLNDKKVENIYKELRKIIRNLSVASISILNKKLSGEDIELSENLSNIYNKLEEAQKLIRETLLNDEKLNKLKEYPYAYFERKNNDVYVYLPDVATYIQASGRTSRMYIGGLTKGISIVLSENENLVNGLERKLRWRYFGFKFKKYNEVNIKSIVKEVDEDRKKVRLVKEGKIKEIEFKEPIKTVLFIVESPNKARTIANFFGKPARRRFKDVIVYETSTGNYLLLIAATVGHIFDLVEDEEFYGVKVERNKFIPIYGTIKRTEDNEQYVSDNIIKQKNLKVVMDKLETIEILRELAKEADLILISTDPDEEGEKIAWDVYNILKPLGKEIKRAEFHEVTLPAILNALKEHRDINENWVKAQIVRRIEDRWIGFSLSKKLWEHFNKYWLSAGRVQTPVLGWVIKRYDERAKDLHVYLRIKTKNGFEFKIDFPEIKSDKEINKLIDEIKKEKVIIEKLEEREEELKPLPPYDTEKMILDASLYLHFSASKTMKLAQDLFENAFITYHRTDSVRVSNAGIEVAKEFIEKEIKRPELFYPRKWGEGGAHECIRPTLPIDTDDLQEIIEERGLQGEITEDHLKLYDLILRRFIASQMKPARVKVVRYKIKLANKEVDIEGVAKYIEKSWIDIYKPLFIKELPDITIVEDSIEEIEGYLDSEYKLYTQGTLIAEMRRKGIGRPSTYATIVRKIIERRYVEDTREGLIPTPIGRDVYFFLYTNFYKFVSEERTRELEKKKELIMENKEDYIRILRELYQEIQEVEKIKIYE